MDVSDRLHHATADDRWNSPQWSLEGRDTEAKMKVCVPARNRISVIQSAAGHYTDRYI
jgi:hypothetical protein